MRLSGPGGHRKYPRAYLKQRTLARPILSNDAKSLPAADLEADVSQSPKIPMETAGVERSQLLQAVARRRVNGVAFRNTRKFNSNRHQPETLDNSRRCFIPW